MLKLETRVCTCRSQDKGMQAKIRDKGMHMQRSETEGLHMQRSGTKVMHMQRSGTKACTLKSGIKLCILKLGTKVMHMQTSGM